MAREMMRRTVLVFLLTAVCGVPAIARETEDGSTADRLYRRSVEQLTREADGSVRLLNALGSDLLPAVQRLLEAGLTEEAQQLVDNDVGILIGLLRTLSNRLVTDLQADVQKLNALGATKQADALTSLVNGQLLPAVQKADDRAVRRLRAALGDGSV